eukprot:353594-Chlamydomonas_euryale.AAC.2
MPMMQSSTARRAGTSRAARRSPLPTSATATGVRRSVPPTPIAATATKPATSAAVDVRNDSSASVSAPATRRAALRAAAAAAVALLLPLSGERSVAAMPPSIIDAEFPDMQDANTTSTGAHQRGGRQLSVRRASDWLPLAACTCLVMKQFWCWSMGLCLHLRMQPLLH